MRPHLWITFGQISMGAEKTVKIAGVDQRRPPVVSRRFYFFFLCVSDYIWNQFAIFSIKNVVSLIL